jgi:hypothetical protein
MKYRTIIAVVFIVIVVISFMFLNHIEAQSGKPGNEKLVIIWSSADREVALNMVFMYASNSKKFGWWEDITLVVWGPSAKLLAEDKELQEYMKRMIDHGIVVKACKLCSDNYGVSRKLEELGIIVKYMKELTDYIKEDRNILTF